MRQHAAVEDGHGAEPRLARLPLVADHEEAAEAADLALELLELVGDLIGVADDPDVVEEVLEGDPVSGISGSTLVSASIPVFRSSGRKYCCQSLASVPSRTRAATCRPILPGAARVSTSLTGRAGLARVRA
jgi:hypothetical protein